MSIHLFLLAAVDGLSYAGLLFMISLGLTLICGVFGVINVAHGSFYAIGGYSAATVMMWLLPNTSSTAVLLLALLLTALLVGAVLGVLLEKYLMRYFQDRDPVLQLLVTFAAFMMLENIQRMIWGVTPVNVGELVGRMGAVELFGVTFMNYQLLFVPGIALLSFILLQGVLKHTIWGRKVMAVVYSREIATALGVNAVRVGALTFAVAGAFGALGGALAVPMSSFVPGIAAEMIVASFAVIATAGLGQIVGALIAAILIGVARALAIYTVPELEVVMPYLIMVLVLLIRPNGLFTVAEARRV